MSARQQAKRQRANYWLRVRRRHRAFLRRPELTEPISLMQRRQRTFEFHGRLTPYYVNTAALDKLFNLPREGGEV